MRTPTLLVVALTICIATAAIPALITLAPRAQPTASVDPWQCITERLAQYLDVPKPTGSLFDELQSYAAELYEPCLAAITIEHCPFPAQSDWCAFTTAAPAAVLPAYSAYASQAYSWWAARSSTLSFLTEDCPNVWHSILLTNAGSEEWLNDTIAFARCHADALTTATSSPTAPALSGSETTETTAASRSAVDSLTPTSTDASNGGHGWVGAEMWILAIVGFTAVAVSSEW
ncbi:hypothetical protein V493_02384 [Pseudogymnoascus sp. VKM F-4281 (FW-2241)]|nr:hypothetical protein V493_02384 [Pseudogymnoascus sp. VKM F-4281 (FW-2241)]